MASRGGWNLQSQDPPPSYSKALDANDVPKEYSCPPHTDSDRSIIQERTIHDGNSVIVEPSSPPRKGWKPYSMRAPTLVFLILTSLALAGLIEFLAQKSQRQGGLSLRVSDDGIPGAVKIAYMYLPTTISVIYSMVWTWVDLDIRRLQPWLDLSRESGAAAESSLLLDYPFEFLAFIPVKAARRRHWLVFLGGLIMMLIFWGITPFQAAIFAVRPVNMVQEVPMIQTAELAPLDQQLDAMDEMILDTGYGITYLSQQYPAYTTSEYVALPFAPLGSELTVSGDEKWTFTTTALTTNLQCWPAGVSHVGDNLYNFDNNRGCKADVLFQPGSTYNISYSLLYIGWHEQASLDWYLSNPDCGRNASHQFLAVFAKADNQSIQSNSITAQFCEPTYQKQNITLTVSATSDHQPEPSFIPLGDPVELSESELNITAFEYLIGTGVPPKEMLRDFPRVAAVELFSELIDKRLTWPATNVVGYALGGTNHSLEDFEDPKILQNVFSAAHKNLFSAAVPQMLQQSSGVTTGATGARHYTLYGVVVNRLFAALVETLLCVVAGMVGVLLTISLRATSKLQADPGGRGVAYATLGESSDLLEAFSTYDYLDDEALKEKLRGYRYKLESSSGGAAAGFAIRRVPQRPMDGPGNELNGGTTFTPFRPAVLHPVTGLGFLVTMFLAIGLLAYLKSRELLLGGLPRPTDNFDVLQLLENYVPTVFATLVEPFLVLLNRLLCLLQPFHDLQRGNAAAKRTLDTAYTTIPPQLTLWRALKARHLLLAIFCACSLLANVLAVALGGLFNELSVAVDYPQQFQQNLTPSISRNTIDPSPVSGNYNHFYIAAANFSSGITLPPWVGRDFAYFPVSPAISPSGMTATTYRARTRGFGVEATCVPLSRSPGVYPLGNLSLDTSGDITFSIQHDLGNGSMPQCDVFMGSPNFQDSSGRPLIGTYKYEIANRLLPGNYQNSSVSLPPGASGFCEERMLLGWVKVDATTNASRTIRETHVECVPKLRTALFDITLDNAGHILASEMVGNYDDVFNLTSSQTTAIIQDVARMVGDRSSELSTMLSLESMQHWHNDSLTRDWWNYLLKLKLNSSELIEPASDVPDADVIIPHVEELYRMLFSIIVGMNLSFFNTSAQPIIISGTMTVEETRIFMDLTALTVSILILALNAIVASVFYLRNYSRFLPRLPSTIGSLAAYVAASRAVRMYVRPDAAQKHIESKGRNEARYSYGKYTGLDGRPHIGIEFAQYVSPLGLSDIGKSSSSRKRLVDKGGWFRRRR